MAAHGTKSAPVDERVVLGNDARPLYFGGAVAGIVGLLIAMVLGFGHADDRWQPFLFAYTAAYCFFLSIVLGALFFVLTQHLTAAGWSVSVRRIAESITSLMPAMAALAIPLVVSAVMQSGTLYAWAISKNSYSQAMQDAIIAGNMEAAARIHAHETGEDKPEAETEAPAAATHSPAPHQAMDPITLQKHITGLHWLNPWFFAARIVIYVLTWMWIARFYRRLSVRQDTTGDISLSRHMQKASAMHTVLLGLTLTGAAGDLFMSLDPHWFSTMWGVYYFAGSAIAIFAVLIIAVYLLQNAGYLRQSINREHYQDLGKYLFAFTFFWGYIAFSQFMLLWYSSIPDEIGWFSRHGATTAAHNINGWSYVILAILFGQLLIPFAGLLSRHVKRKFGILVFWAVWQLAFHLVDTYWIVMPEYPGHMSAWTVLLGIAMTVGMGGLLLAVLIRNMLGQNLRPVADPRLVEALAFHNI